MTTLEASYHKPRCNSSPIAFCSHPQTICFCVISRLTYFSCFVVITFVVLITQEFTFVKYANYVPSLSSEDMFFHKYTNLSGKGILKPDNITEDWIEVTDNVYAYSAYWDTRINNEYFVRIIGGIKDTGSNLDSTKCLLKYYNSSIVLEVLSNIKILNEHHNMPSKAVYIKCLTNTDEQPSHVALVTKEWNDTWSIQPSWMSVLPLDSSFSHDIGVCVRPMFNFTDVFVIAEFIAFYEALGVSHFTFYDYDTSIEAIKFFYSLQKENYSIEVMPWSLPPNVNSMWAVGQLASINDCLYRSMGKIAYTVVVDFDEFITPRYVMTLPELMKIQDDPKRRSAGFVLRSRLFCSEYEQDKLPVVIPPFKTQSNIRREKYIYPFLVRSKYIVKPLMIEVAGIHNVWEFLPGWEQWYVPAIEALVHHYRSRLCGEVETLEKGQIDVKSRKYLNQLMRSKAVEVWRKMFSNQ